LNPVGRWFAIAGVAVLGSIGAAGLAIAVYMAWLFHSLPDARELAEYRPPTSTRVFAYDGTLIGEFAKERRIFVAYDQIPEVLIQAFLAAEDRNFFQHGGIDMMGFSRAVARLPLHYVRGTRPEGGSTITQQVAKNVLLSNDVTFARKIKEAILARRLEETLDKEQILELYMNEVYLGYRSYGVGAAAFNYFGKSLTQLTPAEAAYLAALLKGPENYHPAKRKAQAIARRNWIIGEMAELGWLSRADAAAAKRQDLVVQKAPQRAKYQDADYFVEEVRLRALASKWGEDVDEGGYYIRTTLDPRLQSAARVALMNGIESYDRRHGWRGAWANVPLADGWEKAAAKRRPPSERRGWRPAAVETVDGGAVRVRLTDGGGGLLDAGDVTWANAGAGLKVGDLIFVEAQEGGRFGLKQIPQVNGALVAMDPWTGRVLAMVGGYSFSLSKFNRATQAQRQPGSAFKPFVYATALENGFTPASQVLDAPVTFRGANGQAWTPENYSRRSYGWQSLRNGLVYSRNQMTVRLADRIGMRKVRDNAIEFGVVKDMAPVLAMALGSGETTPFKITAAYAPFVNGGRTVEPHTMVVVHDRDGKAIYRAEDRECPRNKCLAGYNGDESPRFPLPGKQVIHPVTAYQITTMLEGVVQQGTATAALVLNRPIAGKTGTTNEYRSAWFVGYSPDLVTGVFIGFDDNRSLGDGETGGAAALPMFVDFMGEALKNTPPKPFVPPTVAQIVTVGGMQEVFRPGTEPGAQPPGSARIVADRPRMPQVERPAATAGQTPAGPTPAPTPPPPPPQTPKVPEDLSGLY
jgi:penicillin-binding protein 1A